MMTYIVPYSTLSCYTYIVSYAIVTRCTYIVPYSTDTNNFVILFPQKEIHKLTWISPNQRDKKQIDHLLISGKWRRPLQDVHFRSGVDVGSSHHLVVAHNTLKLKRTVTPIRLLKWFKVSKLKDAGISNAVIGQKEETQRLAEVETRGQQQNISSVFLQTLTL